MEASAQDLGQALQRFGAADYCVFALMLLLCAAIGVYFGFFAGARSADDYLMGGRSMGVVPISLSLIASLVSGITLLGTATEIYLYGTQYSFIILAIILMAFVLTYAILPVFHDLQFTSTYEYLEMRFGKEVRLMGSLLFFINVIFWIPIVIYVAALTFNQVTGVNVHIVSPLVSLVCIFYTCVGGLKAVVWTDVVQSVAMFGSMLLVMIKGTADVGGIGVVWSRNWESGRLEMPGMSLNFTERHSWIVLIVGGIFQWLQTCGANQIMMQRYLAVPTLAKARFTVWAFVLGAVILLTTCCYTGLVTYATYHDCDPLTTKVAAAKDQLLPLLVMRTLGQWPGLPGCFVAGIFSAALSTMSTGMNSMSAVVLEDFYKPFWKRPLTERQTNVLMRTVVVVTGVVCVLLVFVVEKLGSVLQLAISVGAMTNGPLLGIFLMGLFLPWVNKKGMLVGSCTGLLLMGWIVLGAQAAIATGGITFPTKPFSVEGCSYSFPTPAPALALNATLSAAAHAHSDVLPLYRLSYMWHMFVGAVVSSMVALPVSFLTGANKSTSVDLRLLSPVVRRFFAARREETLDGSSSLVTNGYKSVELRIISNAMNAEEKEKESELESR